MGKGHKKQINRLQVGNCGKCHFGLLAKIRVQSGNRLSRTPLRCTLVDFNMRVLQQQSQ
jgi:hypothetical protein